MAGAETWHHETLRHYGSGCLLSQQLIPFLYLMQSMLSACPRLPLQLAPPEAWFYLPGQPSNDSALTT